MLRITMPILLTVSTLLLLKTPINKTTFEQLEPNKTYSSYDFNRDGKKDEFRYEMDNKNGEVYVYLNNTKSTVPVALGAGIFYYRYSKSNEFLLVNKKLIGGVGIEVYSFINDKADWRQSLSSNSFEWNVIDAVDGMDISIISGPNHSHQMRSLQQAMDKVDDVITFKKSFKLDPACHVFYSDSPYFIPTENWELTLTSVTDSSLLNTSSEYDSDNQKGIKLIIGEKYTLQRLVEIEPGDSPDDVFWKKRMELKNSKGETGWITSTPDWVFS